MKQYDQVQLNKLNPGDRFYFACDKKKAVHTLDNVTPFVTIIQKGYTKHYANCRPDAVKPGALQVEKHLADRRVIFLRNIKDKPRREYIPVYTCTICSRIIEQESCYCEISDCPHKFADLGA